MQMEGQERIGKPENRAIEITHSEQLYWKKINTLWDLWDYNKRSNSFAMEIREGAEKGGGLKKYLKK